MLVNCYIMTAMNVIHELPPPFNTVVIENEAGTYKDFHLPPGDTYPLPGILYPVDYGYLPGYIGEDGHDLDIFVGTDVVGALGYMVMDRGEVIGDEHKYYIGMTDGEVASVLKVYEPVLLEHVALSSLAELTTSIDQFKAELPQPGSVEAQLHEVRERIDAVDLKILDALMPVLDALKERSEFVEEVTVVKALAGMETYQKARFEQLLAKLQAAARQRGIKDEELVEAFWNVLHESSKRQQDAAKHA